jgi:hypothetical protein
MTGLPDMNRPAFEAEERRLYQLEHDPVNPHKLTPPPEESWHLFMRRDLRELLDCHAIVMLPGWTESPGAREEHRLAILLKIPVYPAGWVGDFDG